MSTTKNPAQFALLSRILHWLMAALLVAMVSSLGDYHRLLTIHRPLGISILILAAIRLVTRMLTRLPPFPPSMPQSGRFVAKLSERLLISCSSPYHWLVGPCCQQATTRL